ncbi:MAG: MBL fold metallo-hydrolase [Cytophagaceae bacterium]|nr:MBL fold metallo-hydrolase [Cytophagaceae bacterium]MDW8456851.1 MBL fold metallo-hydrolase [Cytophagaceae bacterium]
MQLTFYGATQQVTGSMFLLEINHYRMLIDCGSDLENQQINNSSFPFAPHEIDIVLLTHAHIDHSGQLPELLKQGYRGQILCTAPTMELAGILLQDKLSLESKKINRLKNRTYRYAHRTAEIMARADNLLKNTMERFVPISYNKPFAIRDDILVTFIPSGHLLGAASIYIQTFENGTEKTILFSGDVGRKNYPLLCNPQPVPPAQYLVCESTYGAQTHEHIEAAEDYLKRIIYETCVQIPGRLIIPAFSIGRIQSLLFTLHKLHLQGQLPRIKIFTDSPMAEMCAKLYEKYLHLLNSEAQHIYNQRHSLFDFENMFYIQTPQSSRLISNYHEPCIILSSSGMIAGGRVMHHISKNIRNAYSTILIVGYCAEGTIGEKLCSGTKYIRIDKKTYPVEARMEKTDIYSAHADKHELMEFIKQQSPGSLKKIFLVHGDMKNINAFRKTILENGYSNVETPLPYTSYTL